MQHVQCASIMATERTQNSMCALKQADVYSVTGDRYKNCSLITVLKIIGSSFYSTDAENMRKNYPFDL